MGNGSKLVLFNGTSHDWKFEKSTCYQMSSWNGQFPAVISAGTAGFVYFEYDQRPFKNRSDTNGEATYSFDTMSFKVTVKDGPEKVIVELNGVRTAENPSGDQVEQQLTWMHNDWTAFHIIARGDTGTFLTEFSSADWMQKNLNWLGSRPLHSICMPGSHNAGMSTISQVFANDVPAIRDFMGPLCQCQKVNVEDQLRWGSRYLDIRPFISGGQYWTGHYTGNKGARGQSISEIVDSVNRFTSQFHELIILDFSHVTNSDEKSGDGWRENFNQQEWDGLLGLLSKINDRFIVPEDRKNDISQLRLTDFIGAGHAAVLIVAHVPQDSTLGDYASKGFYVPSQLKTFDQYSDSPQLDTMTKDQLSKMHGFMVQKDPGIFLLSWTLTQKIQEIIKTIENKLLPNVNAGDSSIAGLAAQANQALFTQLIPNVSENAFPNIVYLDYLYGSSLFAGLALAINAKVGFVQ